MNRILLGIVLVFFWVSSAGAIQMFSVTGENVNMRNGPGKNYAVLWELGKGFPLMLVKSQGKWVKIKDFEGDVGWVYKNLISKTPHLIVKVNKNSKKRVNIRSGPSTKYRIIGKATYGVVFKTLERGKGWVKIKHEDGLTGWIKRSLLWGW